MAPTKKTTKAAETEKRPVEEFDGRTPAEEGAVKAQPVSKMDHTVTEDEVDAVAGTNGLTAKGVTRVEKPEPPETIAAAASPRLPVDEGQAEAQRVGIVGGVENVRQAGDMLEEDGSPAPSAPLDPLAEPKGNKNPKSVSSVNEVREFHNQRPGHKAKQSKLEAEAAEATKKGTNFKQAFEGEVKRSFSGVDVLVRDDELVIVPRTAGAVSRTVRYGARKLDNASDRRGIIDDMRTVLGG
jgi:hypothetical protein